MELTEKTKNKHRGAFIISFTLLLFGILVIVWNTNRAKDRTERDNRAISEAVEVSPTKIDPVNEGKYVIIYGSLQTEQVFHDQFFDIKYPGVFYERLAETAERASSNDETDNNDWTINTPLRTEVSFIEEDSKSKACLEYVAAKPIKIQDFIVHPSVFEFDQALRQPIFLENFFNFDKYPDYYLLQDHILTNADDPDYPQIGAGRYKFFGIPNGTNVTMMGMQEGHTIGMSGKAKVLLGIRNKQDLFDGIKSDAKSVESGIYYLSLFFLGLASIGFSYLIKARRIPNPMHNNLFNLKLGRVIYIVLLTIILFHGLLGVFKLLLSGNPMSSLVHFGYVAVIITLSKLIFSRHILPRFLFNDEV